MHLAMMVVLSYQMKARIRVSFSVFLPTGTGGSEAESSSAQIPILRIAVMSRAVDIDCATQGLQEKPNWEDVGEKADSRTLNPEESSHCLGQRYLVKEVPKVQDCKCRSSKGVHASKNICDADKVYGWRFCTFLVR